MSVIPVVDLKLLTSGNNEPSLEEWETVAAQMRKALHEVGFMYLVNHAIPQEVVDQNFDVSRQFFELPLTTKQKYKKDLEKSRNGWVEPGQELLHEDSKFEYRECFDFTTKERFYPQEIPSFESVHEELELRCKKLIEVVLKLLAISLKLKDADYFIKRCRHLNAKDVANECDFSMIYYPPISSETQLPPDTVRCAEHTDYEIMTFLFQNKVGGLEIKTANGDWISANPIPNTILVNTGDLLEVWTNYYYKATLHRVTIPKTEEERKQARYSFAYFIAPDDETLVEPLHSPVIDENLKKNGLECGNRKATKIVPGKDANSKFAISAYDHIIQRVHTAYGVAKN